MDKTILNIKFTIQGLTNLFKPVCVKLKPGKNPIEPLPNCSHSIDENPKIGFAYNKGKIPLYLINYIIARIPCQTQP